MALSPGTILGQYEIRAPLGAGGMGEVYRAHDTRLDRDVAIKVLPESLTSDPERLRRFEQEARATAALNHPNILAVYQMATQGNVSYLVEELLDGETLRERLRRGSIPLRKAIDYGVQIAHGLAAAHDKGIIHRDLKPENLFLTKDGRVKILDFGLARLGPSKEASGQEATVTQKTDPGVVLGTAGYMSPEQVRGKTVDNRTDIFALGTILYEMVTGKQPFRKPTSAETMTAILNDDPPSISQISANTPPGLQRVVHRCLEKDPDHRFHSAHDLAFALEALSDSAITKPTGSHIAAKEGWTRRRVAIATMGAVIVLGAALFTYFWLRPERAPKVSNYVQLTHDGQQKQLVGTDGARLYLGLGQYGAQGAAQMPISGGDPITIPVPSPNIYPGDVSPDGSRLLVIDGLGAFGRGPLWSLPVLGGVPRRLGDTVGIDATWSPDGKLLSFSDGGELFLANADGNDSHKLIAMNSAAVVSAGRWSPDGRRIRFDVSQNANSPPVIWELSADGKDLHQLLPGWTKPPDSECCGRWTADGMYFVFQSRRQIWALPKMRGFLHSTPKPVQLTFSPLSLGSPLPSKDGKKLFVVGRTFRGELMRYDVTFRQFVPFLGGISAEYVDFSKDGQWVAYVSFPDGTLWRSKADGSERLQLTYPPAYAFMPRWSPDGRKIVFFGDEAGKPSRIFEVSPEGGTPRQLMPGDPNHQTDPNWSPDGSKMIFAGAGFDAASTIRVLDLGTRKVETLPASQGFFAPRWSPSGRYVVALTVDQKTLLLFDFQTQNWTELVKGSLGFMNWSKDGQSIYVLDNSGTPAVLKIRISDRKIERAAELKDFVTTGHYGSSLALAPDDSLVLLREAGSQDVYSLDWEEP